MPLREWEAFNEVHGDRIPRTERNRKWTEEAVRLVLWGLVALAMSAGFAIVPDEGTHSGPGVFTPDESQSTVLSKMAREYVIMLMLKNTYAETVWSITGNLRDEDPFVEKKKSGWI